MQEESTFFRLDEGMKINMSSEFDVLGEEIEVIKQQGNLFFTKGKYGKDREFYRLYIIDNEGVNICFEATEEQPEYDIISSYIEKADYDSIFSLEPNQELFILKSPYTTGTEWGYGRIISANKETLVVEFENKNKYIFKQGIGLVKIQYKMPDDMKKFFDESKFYSERTEG